MPTNGWNEYKKLIIHELDEHNKKLDTIIESVSIMKNDISALKVKAALVGGVAGLIGTGIVTAVLTAFK